VLAAKAVVISAVLFLTTFVFSLSAYGIGTVLLPSDDYATGQPFPALLGIALCFSATGVLGLAIGAFLRNSAGAITAVLGFILLPALLGPLFGDLQRWVAAGTPTAALERLTQTSDATPEIVGSIGCMALAVGHVGLLSGGPPDPRVDAARAAGRVGSYLAVPRS